MIVINSNEDSFLLRMTPKLMSIFKNHFYVACAKTFCYGVIFSLINLLLSYNSELSPSSLLISIYLPLLAALIAIANALSSFWCFMLIIFAVYTTFAFYSIFTKGSFFSSIFPCTCVGMFTSVCIFILTRSVSYFRAVISNSNLRLGRLFSNANSLIGAACANLITPVFGGLSVDHALRLPVHRRNFWLHSILACLGGISIRNGIMHAKFIGKDGFIILNSSFKPVVSLLNSLFGLIPLVRFGFKSAFYIAKVILLRKNGEAAINNTNLAIFKQPSPFNMIVDNDFMIESELLTLASKDYINDTANLTTNAKAETVKKIAKLIIPLPSYYSSLCYTLFIACICASFMLDVFGVVVASPIKNLEEDPDALTNAIDSVSRVISDAYGACSSSHAQSGMTDNILDGNKNSQKPAAKFSFRDIFRPTKEINDAVATKKKGTGRRLFNLAGLYTDAQKQSADNNMTRNENDRNISVLKEEAQKCKNEKNSKTSKYMPKFLAKFLEGFFKHSTREAILQKFKADQEKLWNGPCNISDIYVMLQLAQTISRASVLNIIQPDNVNTLFSFLLKQIHSTLSRLSLSLPAEDLVAMNIKFSLMSRQNKNKKNGIAIENEEDDEDELRRYKSTYITVERLRRLIKARWNESAKYIETVNTDYSNINEFLTAGQPISQLYSGSNLLAQVQNYNINRGSYGILKDVHDGTIPNLCFHGTNISSSTTGVVFNPASNAVAKAKQQQLLSLNDLLPSCNEGLGFEFNLEVFNMLNASMSDPRQQSIQDAPLNYNNSIAFNGGKPMFFKTNANVSADDVYSAYATNYNHNGAYTVGKSDDTLSAYENNGSTGNTIPNAIRVAKLQQQQSESKHNAEIVAATRSYRDRHLFATFLAILFSGLPIDTVMSNPAAIRLYSLKSISQRMILWIRQTFMNLWLRLKILVIEPTKAIFYGEKNFYGILKTFINVFNVSQENLGSFGELRFARQQLIDLIALRVYLTSLSLVFTSETVKTDPRYQDMLDTAYNTLQAAVAAITVVPPALNSFTLSYVMGGASVFSLFNNERRNVKRAIILLSDTVKTSTL